MFRKILKAVKRSKLTKLYFLERLKQTQVRKVVKDGKVYFRYKGILYPEYLNRGNAMSFIEEKAKKYCHGYGIDVGAGEWPLPGTIPIQDKVYQSAYKLDNFKDGSLDFVFSSHCLEHLERWEDVMVVWIRKLRIGGILFLYLPHKSMALWHPGASWVRNDHKWIPRFEVINSFLINNGMEIIEYESEKDNFWSFHIVAKKIKWMRL